MTATLRPLPQVSYADATCLRVAARGREDPEPFRSCGPAQTPAACMPRSSCLRSRISSRSRAATSNWSSAAAVCICSVSSVIKPTSSPRAALLASLIQELTDQMKGAAAELQFEVAARLRDEISDLKKELRSMVEATK